MFIRLLTLAACLVVSQVAATEWPKHAELSEKDGSTKVWAEAKVSIRPDSGLVEINVKTRKSGIHGKGYGYAEVALLDKGNNIWTSPTVQKHKGAHSLKGHASGETGWVPFPIPLDAMQRADAILLTVRAEDSGGFDDSLVEMFDDRLDEAHGLLKKTNQVLMEAGKTKALFLGL